MSLYNMVHGVHPLAPQCLGFLGFSDVSVIPRLRDAWLENGQIVIYTRTGGNNRADYDNSPLTEHLLYLRDEDDDYDSTYAKFYFSVPEGVEGTAEAEAMFPPPAPSEERWKEATKRMGDAVKEKIAEKAQ